MSRITEHADMGRRNFAGCAVFAEGARTAFDRALAKGRKTASDDDLVAAQDAQRKALNLATEGRLTQAVRYHNHALSILGEHRSRKR